MRRRDIAAALPNPAALPEGWVAWPLDAAAALRSACRAIGRTDVSHAEPPAVAVLDDGDRFVAVLLLDGRSARDVLGPGADGLPLPEDLAAMRPWLAWIPGGVAADGCGACVDVTGAVHRIDALPDVLHCRDDVRLVRDHRHHGRPLRMPRLVRVPGEIDVVGLHAEDVAGGSYEALGLEGMRVRIHDSILPTRHLHVAAPLAEIGRCGFLRISIPDGSRFDGALSLDATIAERIGRGVSVGGDLRIGGDCDLTGAAGLRVGGDLVVPSPRNLRLAPDARIAGRIVAADAPNALGDLGRAAEAAAARLRRLLPARRSA